jgi:hypothetical protein
MAAFLMEGGLEDEIKVQKAKEEEKKENAEIEEEEQDEEIILEKQREEQVKGDPNFQGEMVL